MSTDILIKLTLVVGISYCQFYSNASLGDEPKESILFDSTGKFSGDYLCVADAASGLSYNKTTKKWEGTRFNVNDDRVIFRLSALGTTVRTLYSIDETVMRYKIEMSNPKLNKAELCVDDVDEYSPLSKIGFFSCNHSLTEFYVNLKSMRYMEIYRFGFIDGVDDDRNTPNITIGRCSRF